MNVSHRYSQQMCKWNVNLLLSFSVFLFILSEIINVHRSKTISITQTVFVWIARNFTEMMPRWISFTPPEMVRYYMLKFVKYNKNLFSSWIVINIISCMVSMATSLVRKMYTWQKYDLDIRLSDYDVLIRISELWFFHKIWKKYL